MTITINKGNFPRFAKRLKKSLQNQQVSLPLTTIQDIAAQGLGKENYYELLQLFNRQDNLECISAETSVIENSIDSYERPNITPIKIILDESLKQKIIEETALKIGVGMGRPGWKIGIDHIEEAINQILNGMEVESVKPPPYFNYRNLGDLWTGLEDLKDYQKALLLIFAEFGDGDKIKALEALNDFSIKKQFNPFVTVPFTLSKKAQDIISQHGYVYTVFASMLQFARNTTNLPPAMFLWLRETDRSLWNVLFTVGRSVTYPETVAVMSHWQAELKAKKALVQNDMDYQSGLGVLPSGLGK